MRKSHEVGPYLVRTVILDALAPEFKTPLASIVTAAGGLRELGLLAGEQVELTDIMEAEASGRYSTSLGGTGRRSSRILS